MVNSFKLALKFYKYIAILFAIGFSIYLVIDDLPLAKYIDSASEMAIFAWGHFIYLVLYTVLLAIYYWLAASLVILIYHKIYKPILGQGKQKIK